jgi:2-hydroxychromene-2-carboxylate isomerase
MRGAHEIRFYFSFRSPYAWFAAERIEHELSDLELALEFVPVFPTPETFPNDPTRLPNKLRYVMIETFRFAAEYGLSVKLGAPIDTDWVKPHAAFLGARELGAPMPFMREMFRARFSRAQDLGDDAVIADVAERCGLSPRAVLEAAHTPALQATVSQAWTLAAERDGVFGVPSFVHQKQLYWGHDRLSSLRHALDSVV